MAMWAVAGGWQGAGQSHTGAMGTTLLEKKAEICLERATEAGPGLIVNLD